MTEQKRPLTYRDAGVDIDAGNELVKRIAPVAKRTRRPEVLGGLGGFGALRELPTKYKLSPKHLSEPHETPEHLVCRLQP